VCPHGLPAVEAEWVVVIAGSPFNDLVDDPTMGTRYLGDVHRLLLCDVETVALDNDNVATLPPRKHYPLEGFYSLGGSGI
jgi:hypothetical protein